MSELKTVTTVSKDKAGPLTPEKVLVRWGYAWRTREVLDRPDGTLRHVESDPVFEAVYLVGGEQRTLTRTIDDKETFTAAELQALALACVEEEIR